jgi:hypothetical protein
LAGTFLAGTFLAGTFLAGTFLAGTFLAGTFLAGGGFPEGVADGAVDAAFLAGICVRGEVNEPTKQLKARP